jgi:hypothetical protein
MKQDYIARVSGPGHANPNSPARGGWIEVARLDFAVPEEKKGSGLICRNGPEGASHK